MAREPRPLGGVPHGWKVEEPDHDPDRVGSVGVLRRADPASLRVARRNLRELLPLLGMEDTESSRRSLLRAVRLLERRGT